MIFLRRCFVSDFIHDNRIQMKGDDVLGVLCIFLLVVCYFDYRYHRIPNWLVLLIWVTGLVRSLGMQEEGEPLIFVVKTVFLLLLLYPFFKIGALGAGDVKLFGGCAGYFPTGKVIYFLFFSLLFAAIISILKMFFMQNARERFEYLGEYLAKVACTGNWHLYFENERECRKVGIAMAGPILASVILYLGGIY